MEENSTGRNNNNMNNNNINNTPIGGGEDKDPIGSVPDQQEESDAEENEAHESDANGEEEEEDDDDEDENENEGGTYKFRFEGDMNPLDFVEDDAFGVQPYQRFERLENEYEALAAKKRKALAENPSQRPVKKFRQDNILDASYEASFEEIRESMLGRRRRSRKAKKKGRQRGSKNKMSPEITRKLGDANLHYAHGRFEEAIRLSKEVMKLSPNLPDPYHTLGLIYNAMGDKKKSTNFYMIAARLNPKNASLWKQIIDLSKELGNSGQAIFCLQKAILADPEDVNLRLEHAELYYEIGGYKKAAESYEQISRLVPQNVGALLKATEVKGIKQWGSNGSQQGGTSKSPTHTKIVASN